MRKRSSREIIFIPAWLLLRGKLLIFCWEFSIAENERHCVPPFFATIAVFIWNNVMLLVQTHSVFRAVFPFLVCNFSNAILTGNT
jgi:hypothetical protein